jgi:hypothetical protein
MVYIVELSAQTDVEHTWRRCWIWATVSRVRVLQDDVGQYNACLAAVYGMLCSPTLGLSRCGHRRARGVVVVVSAHE